jgi:hypothetical protein
MDVLVFVWKNINIILEDRFSETCFYRIIYRKPTISLRHNKENTNHYEENESAKEQKLKRSPRMVLIELKIVPIILRSQTYETTDKMFINAC